MLLLFVACTTQTKLPEMVMVDGCVIPSGQTPETLSYPENEFGLTAAFRGTVDAVGSGVPAEGCTSMNAWKLKQEAPFSVSWWFTATDADTQQQWTVGVQELGYDSPVRVGNEVIVDWTWQEGVPMVGQPSITELSIDDFEGAPAAWVGVAAGLSLMDPPQDVSFAVGDEIGRSVEDCYTAVARELDVSNGDASASLGFGDAASLGRFLVVHGGTLEAKDPTCSETEGAQTRFGMRR